MIVFHNYFPLGQERLLPTSSFLVNILIGKHAEADRQQIEINKFHHFLLTHHRMQLFQNQSGVLIQDANPG